MALTSHHASTLNDKQFFFAALKNYTGEVIFYGIIAIVIYLISNWVWWLGLIFFLPFSILTIVSFFQSLIIMPNAISTTITYFHIRKHGTEDEKAIVIGNQKPEDQNYVLATSFISLTRSLIILGFAIWLASSIFF